MGLIRLLARLYAFFIVYMAMVYARSCVQLSVTHLGIEKEKHVNTGVWDLNCCAPRLLTSSLDRIKNGAAHNCELEMYVCSLCNQSFSTQGSLKRHRESVHR